MGGMTEIQILGGITALHIEGGTSEPSAVADTGPSPRPFAGFSAEPIAGPTAEASP